MSGYAYIARDSVGIRLIAAGSGKDLQDSNAQQHCYIDITGIDALYEKLETHLKK